MNAIDDKFAYLKPKLLSSRVYPEFFQLLPGDRVVNLGCGNAPQAVIYRGQFSEMVGLDINEERLRNSREASTYYRVPNFTPIRANVEKTPIMDGSFDKAIAIDIIEHLENPREFCVEVNRILRPEGELLVTFPALHDKFTHFASNFGRLFLGRRTHKAQSEDWDPDAHNAEHPLREWIAIVEDCGFSLSDARASTLFPPLHLYGVPKFWLSNDFVHKIDSYLCSAPFLRNYGQALVCVFTKTSQ